MKVSGMIRAMSLITGLAVALTITFSQLFFSQSFESKAKKVEAEQSTTPHQDQSFISFQAGSLPAAHQFEVIYNPSFILEFVFQDGEPKSDILSFKVLSGKLFETLFQEIIAPNAP